MVQSKVYLQWHCALTTKPDKDGAYLVAYKNEDGSLDYQHACWEEGQWFPPDLFETMPYAEGTFYAWCEDVICPPSPWLLQGFKK